MAGVTDANGNLVCISEGSTAESPKGGGNKQAGELAGSTDSQGRLIIVMG